MQRRPNGNNVTKTIGEDEANKGEATMKRGDWELIISILYKRTVSNNAPCTIPSRGPPSPSTTMLRLVLLRYMAADHPRATVAQDASRLASCRFEVLQPLIGHLH